MSQDRRRIDRIATDPRAPRAGAISRPERLVHSTTHMTSTQCKAAATSVRSPWIPLAKAYARSRDLDLDGELPEGSCEVDRFVRWTEDVAEACRDEHVGVAIARWMPRGTYRFVEYAARSAPTLLQSLEIAAAYAPLMNDRLRMRVVEGATEIKVEHWIEGEPRSLGQHFDEFAMATATRFVREVIEGAVVTRVHFVHSKRCGTPIDDVLGVQARHGEDRNAFVVRRSDATRVLQSAEAPLARLLCDAAEREVKALESPDVVTRVRMEVGRSLASSDAVVAVVAKKLGLSTRTLERRLAESGTTFDEVRDAYRRDYALHLLARREPLASVAKRLRFKSLRGVTRALERWGMAAG